MAGSDQGHATCAVCGKVLGSGASHSGYEVRCSRHTKAPIRLNSAKCECDHPYSFDGEACSTCSKQLRRLAVTR